MPISNGGSDGSSVNETGRLTQVFPRPENIGRERGVACLFQKEDGSGYEVLYIRPRIAVKYNRIYMENSAGRKEAKL